MQEMEAQEQAVWRKGVQDEAMQETTVDGMADRESEYIVRARLNGSLPDHDGLLLICKGSRIGMHSRHTENSLKAKDKATQNTPLNKVYYIVGK